MALSLLALFLALKYFTLVNSDYPEASETREVLSLDGIWNCCCEKEGDPTPYIPQRGPKRANGIVKMPIPGSFFDFIAQMDPKSCPTVVWYERSFFIPKNWKNDQKIWLCLDGVLGGIELWINGEKLSGENKTDVPFECDVTDKLIFEAENRIALAVDRRLVDQFSGTPLSVSLRTVPEMLFIESVSVNTTVTNGTAFITYKVIADGLLRLNRKCISIQALDTDGTLVASDTACDRLEGTFSIPNCHLWWPLCMDTNSGYLYTLVFKLYYKYCDSVIRDVYRQKIGIRSLSWCESSLLINGKAFYLQAAEANHEWSRLPFDPRTGLKDVALLKWLNANALGMQSASTEEMLNLADVLGLFVVLGSSKGALEDVVKRYGNHPSVVLWSLGENFDASLIDNLKSLDSTRPFTGVVPLSASIPPMADKLDIVSVNLADHTLPDDSTSSSTFLQDKLEKFQKPLIVLFGDKLLSTNYKVRTLVHDPYAEVISLQRQLDNLVVNKNVSVVGEFFGNLVAYEHLTGESVELIDGIFNRNHEPTALADFIRSKFRERKSSCFYRTPRCKHNRKHRKRI